MKLPLVYKLTIMKKILLQLIFFVITTQLVAQQDLIENTWILHSMVIENVTYNVPQPSAQDPNYNPGVTFFEDSEGYHVSAIIYSNSFFSLEPIIINPDNFIIPQGGVTLGQCDFYCDLESLYLGIFFGPDFPSTFSYEIQKNSNGKVLIITSPEEDVAIHGNYVLSNTNFSIAPFAIYPNPATDELFIVSENIKIDTLVVYAISGQKVLEFSNPDTIVNIGGITEGLYFLEITTAEGNSIQQFIKE
jgi:hypothetical protein